MINMSNFIVSSSWLINANNSSTVGVPNHRSKVGGSRGSAFVAANHRAHRLPWFVFLIINIIYIIIYIYILYIIISFDNLCLLYNYIIFQEKENTSICFLADGMIHLSAVEKRHLKASRRTLTGCILKPPHQQKSTTKKKLLMVAVFL